METQLYLEKWLDTYIKPTHAPSTVACYRRAFAALPAALMHCDLADLDGMAIQAALYAKAVKHPRAAQLQYSALSCALRRAQKLRYIPYSPMEAVDKPKHQARQTDTLTVDQLHEYLTFARQSEVYPLLLLIVICGLRRGEALGLQWRDLAGDTLHICRQRQMIARQGYQVRPLKSRTSNRTILLPPEVAADLRRRRADLSPWIHDTTPARLDKAHKHVLLLAGLPHCTLHGLRHSMATAVAAQGTPIKILQGLLGHSHYSLTADLYASHLSAADVSPALGAFSARVL